MELLGPAEQGESDALVHCVIPEEPIKFPFAMLRLSPFPLQSQTVGEGPAEPLLLGEQAAKLTSLKLVKPTAKKIPDKRAKVFTLFFD